MRVHKRACGGKLRRGPQGPQPEQETNRSETKSTTYDVRTFEIQCPPQVRADGNGMSEVSEKSLSSRHSSHSVRTQLTGLIRKND